MHFRIRIAGTPPTTGPVPGFPEILILENPGLLVAGYRRVDELVGTGSAADQPIGARAPAIIERLSLDGGSFPTDYAIDTLSKPYPARPLFHCFPALRSSSVLLGS